MSRRPRHHAAPSVNHHAELISLQLELAISRADAYLKSRGFDVQQVNGQRISVLKSSWPLPADETANEVFIGKIPRNLFEDSILPILERAGTVYKLRLMMDFGRTNRGFGYARYLTKEEARRAQAELETVCINPTDRIHVLASFDNRRLYIGNLPINCTTDFLESQLRVHLDGIESVELPEVSPDEDRRHAFVQFESHYAATQARRITIPRGLEIGGRAIQIDWAKPHKPSNCVPRRRPSNENYPYLGFVAQQLLEWCN